MKFTDLFNCYPTWWLYVGRSAFTHAEGYCWRGIRLSTKIRLCTAAVKSMLECTFENCRWEQVCGDFRYLNTAVSLVVEEYGGRICLSSWVNTHLPHCPLFHVPLMQRKEPCEGNRITWQCRMRKCAVNPGKLSCSRLCSWGSKDRSTSWLETLRGVTTNFDQWWSYLSNQNDSILCEDSNDIIFPSVLFCPISPLLIRTLHRKFREKTAPREALIAV